MAGLYDDTPGLSDGTGLWRGRLGLFSGASGFINGGGGAAYIDLYFSAGTYSVSGSNYTTLGSIPGFTFTRASLAMGYDATGKLVYGPNNTALQSQTFGTTWSTSGGTTTSDQTTAPDGTNTADLLAEDTSTGFHRVFQTINTTAGANYVASVYVKPNGRTQINLTMGGVVTASIFNLTGSGSVVSGPGGITAVGNGWYRIWTSGPCFVSSAAWQILGSVGGSISYTGDGTSGLFLWGAQLEAVTYQTTPSTYYPTTTAAYYGPRLVYDPVTLASQGILVEEARTNLCLQSQTFDSATWGKNNLTVTANQYTAPDGTTGMDKLTASAGNTQHYLLQSLTPSAAVQTVSLYVKYVNHQYIQISCFDGTTSRIACFDLLNGTAGATANCTNSISAWGGGYRITLTSSTALLAAAGNVAIGIVNSNTASNVPAFNAAGTEAIGIWGAQLEAGTGASSPIPTTTASVTRAADAANVTDLSVPNPHSMVAEWTPGFDNATGFRRAASLTNAGFTSEDAIYQRHTNNIVRAFTTTTMDNSLGTGNAATANKAAARFELNKSTGSLNGAAVAAADTSTDPTTAINRLDIGQTAGAANMLNGTISRIRIYNRALSDAQLQSLTT